METSCLRNAHTQDSLCKLVSFKHRLAAGPAQVLATMLCKVCSAYGQKRYSVVRDHEAEACGKRAAALDTLGSTLRQLSRCVSIDTATTRYAHAETGL